MVLFSALLKLYSIHVSEDATLKYLEDILDNKRHKLSSSSNKNIFCLN